MNANAELESIPDITQFENQIAAELFSKVGDYLNLLAGAWSLSGQALLAAFPERMPPLAKQVSAKLLLRLNNDLRCVWMLAAAGYDTQANALAASIYECAFTIATIGDSPDLAHDWLEHENPKKTFGVSAYDLTTRGLANYGAHADWTPKLYKIYSQLCWGKHLNPIVEQQGAMSRNGDEIEYLPGPHADELTVRGICYCCIHAVLFAIIAVEMFTRHHVLDVNRQGILEVLKQLEARREELNLDCLARWGNEDPFPGKW